MRLIRARAEVLRNGAYFKDLEYDLSSPPRINTDASAELPVSSAGRFRWEPDVEWTSDEIKLLLEINGETWPMGVFAVAHMQNNYTETGTRWVELEMYDRALKLKQQKTETLLHLSAGTEYITAIRQMLALGGIATYIATPSPLTLPTDREDWPIGTPLLMIINDLLDEINYNRIWFDGNGTAIITPYETPSGSTIDHVYAAGEFSVLHRAAETETDLFDAPNVFICICENPDLAAPLIATAENDNPRSAASTIRRGIRIPEVIKVDNIASQQALNEFAQRLANDAILASETVEISTGVMPGHGVRDTIALDHPDIKGIFEETAWNAVLGPGEVMHHTLRHVVFS